MRLSSALCLLAFTMSFLLVSQDARAEVTEGSQLVVVRNTLPIASVDVKVCLDPPDVGEGIVITVLHYSPAVGWSSPASFAWSYAADPTGCNTRSGVFWAFAPGTVYVSAALSSGGPSVYLGSWPIN